MNLRSDTRGISLPMTVGLLLLIVSLTVIVNQLVIFALRASHQIEAADKAYFAAEGGIEDALYELSAHSAGYETGNLVRNAADARIDDFSVSSIQWRNQWEIKSSGINPCPVSGWWGYNPTMCGQMGRTDKLVINLFRDDAISTDPLGGISEVPADVEPIPMVDLTVKFRLPTDIVNNNLNVFSDSILHIDNDGDLGISSGLGPENWPGLNEDGADYPPPFFPYPPNFCPYSGQAQVEDNDCDQLEDEDSAEDPVILWQVVTSNGDSFQPLRGCKGDPQHASHTGSPNSVLCEKNFTLVGGVVKEVSAGLTIGDLGVDQDGNIQTLFAFLFTHALAGQTAQLEVLVAAPLEAVSPADGTKILIPYLEYGVQYDSQDDRILPATYFSLQSDGYYQDFKQSITTNVVPRATTRLLDLTIIQQ